MWRRVVRTDLGLGAGTPLLPLRGVRSPWPAWLPHLAVGAYAVFLAAYGWHTLIEDFGIQTVSAGGLAVAHAFALLICLFRPSSGWWLSLATAAATTLTAHPGTGWDLWTGPSMAGHLSVLALAGLRSRPRVLAELWLLTLAAGLVLTVALPDRDTAAGLAQMSLSSAAVLIATGSLRGRAEALRRLAEQERVSGEERERHALLEERIQIAHELHDVVAHHMSVVAIQAEAAPYRVPDPPPELARSFATIRGSALEALAELHRILGLLRAEDVGAQPQPTLDGLPGLVESVRDTGLNIGLEIRGRQRSLPPGVELSAYRIVQEALSNVMRHAPGATGRVEVGYHLRYLELRVTNEASPGRPRPPAASAPGPPRSGHGLVGMRERAVMLGGRLTAEHTADHGYAVTAVLPVTGRRVP
jgi:signal transduction histidine kinase